MNASLELRIAAVFILFGASFLGITIPFACFKNPAYHSLLPLLQTGAAGVMLGLSLVCFVSDLLCVEEFIDLKCICLC